MKCFRDRFVTMVKVVLNEIPTGTESSIQLKTLNNTGDLARRSFQPSPGSPVRLPGLVAYVHLPLSPAR